MIRRRTVTLFSLSFLDCICCGFGAIILLFVLTIGSQTSSLHDLRERMLRVMQQYLTELAQYRSRKDDMIRNASQLNTAAEEARQQSESLRQSAARLEAQVKTQQTLQQQLASEIDKLKQEIGLRQKTPELILPVPRSPLGLPIGGGTHIAIVIDTSGSMRDSTNDRIWPVVIQKIEEVLDIYPEVKGIQVLDADGRFVLGRGNEQWLADSPATRETIRQSVRRYPVYSQSNPVPGILRALRQLYDPSDKQMKMNVYIFGDEFTDTADAVLRAMDRLNPADENGSRPVTISALGFPTAVQMDFAMDNTGVKFANLIREITYRHGGAFIAVVDY